MIDVRRINRLHSETVALWHQEPMNFTHDGLLLVVCRQHSFNYLLWHEEDIARSRDVTDQRIAEVKRNIDGYNQQRNDWIEKIDDWISGSLEEQNISHRDDVPWNTETPGSVIDRLSIMALRIYHMGEQLERTDATAEHLENVDHKLAVCRLQQSDLSNSLQQLIDDIYAGRKRHKTYRQFKMYNDPTLNPYLYDLKLKKAG